MDKKMTLPYPPGFEIREGEERLPFDPATRATDAGLVFIGRVESPWTRREDCPKNMREAGEKGGGARVVLDPAYRAGLRGLDGHSHAILLTWLDRSPRDLIVQRPRHATAATGVFALRSPVRPNPVGVHVVRLRSVDATAGLVDLEAVDVLDGTPLIDIKPYFASTDSVPEASRPTRNGA